MTTIELTQIQIQEAIREDIQTIIDILTERGDPLTLANARFVLAIGLRNRPDAWTVTDASLCQLWPAPAEGVTSLC